MPELTRDIVRSAPQFTNPLKKRELSLRGMHLNQLPLTDSKLWTDIATHFDCLDLSDNLLSWLDSPAILSASEQQEQKNSQQQQQQEQKSSVSVDAEVDDFLSFLTADDATSSNNNNAPSSTSTAIATTSSSTKTKLPPIRLTTILLHNNHLRGISKTFASQLKTSLTSLVLNKNSISDFSACSVFAEFEVLERLSLVGNPVCSQANYRFYVIGTCSKTLKLLDFAKVKDAEREKGKSVKDEIDSKMTTNSATLSMNVNGGGPAIGGGRRAARKAAAAAAAASDLESKRNRDATEQELENDGNVTSVSTRIGNALGKNRNNNNDDDQGEEQQQKKKQYTKEELMAMLDAAETVEEMDRIEAMMNSLTD